ncbi:tRNA (guanine-N(1)-)-methyltransferase TrmD [Clostridium aceticum]|uniref:tRNA (guanine-N(1)-)-methyltransferase n=1 Tax=Clostridium aceticum TaxID=84022 RepID=A0A0D8I9U3_9CLOT|nr:tRNA (guanosine(37)-N1)-methyltransferase TrmD [Clostridium aceticum]AKL95499.1 tRNA (guanine-N(1)-)-methyltransferase TrmD [Clostridium aceticum]KJF25981.1 tRNA (guanine-N1)-methyltransferase [Clostridium aceticum]
MIIKVLTLFPEMFQGPLNVSIIKNAQEKGLLDIEYINIRDFTDSKHKKVDDYPYGGGAGMVMTPQPIFDCYESTIKTLHSSSKPRTIYCSPKGKTFHQEMAIEMAKEKELVFICGHYEGVDQRVIDELITDEISIGDFVLTGGELPVAVIIDTIARLIPGVLGQQESFQEESFYSGLLEYPHYTRPQNFRGLTVPSVLFSGNHKEIEKWRRKKSLEITLHRRPDLIEKAELTEEDKKNINAFKNHC